MPQGTLRLLPLALTALLTVGSVSANEDMDAFFENPENQAKLEMIQNSGQLEQARTQLIEGCKNNAENESLDCDCLEEKVTNLSDREFVYESLRAYEAYQARVAAMEAGDTEKLEALKEEEAQRTSPLSEVETQCAMTNNEDS